MISKIFRDKDGKVVVFQLPNIPLGVWAIATIASHLLRNPWSDISGHVALIAIILWTSLEILAGSSWFRRVLGVIILLLVLINRF